jgi:hypothetical protein
MERKSNQQTLKNTNDQQLLLEKERTILENKPDIIIHDNDKGTCTTIDFAFSRDRNVIKKETGKILKYKEFTIEIQCMRI